MGPDLMQDSDWAKPSCYVVVIKEGVAPASIMGALTESAAPAQGPANADEPIVGDVDLTQQASRKLT